MRQWIEDILAAVGLVAFLYGTMLLIWMLEPLAN
jgi:hypothetical protein